jgi:WD40 repeat protein
MAKPLLDDALGQSPVKRALVQPGGSGVQPPRGQGLPYARLSGGTVSASVRRTIWFVLVLTLLVAVFGLLTLWGIWSFLAPKEYDTPTQLASVPLPLPSGPTSLAWSADGSYIAAGTSGLAIGETVPGEVFVVEVAKASVLTTLKVKSGVEGLAFSPDRKWLAVGTRPSILAGTAPVELVVFDVPAFTARFTAKAARAETGFIDLAWAPDSKSLLALEGPVDNAPGKAEVRRWDMPAFTEQPAYRVPQLDRPVALAVSPDGRTLALGEQKGAGKTSLLIRLFDLGKGAKQSSFTIDNSFHPPRLGFTADGKAVGVYDSQRLSWWDVRTGRPAGPGAVRFAVQPAGLSHIRCYDSVSPDGSWQAWGYERHRGLGDLGWDFREKEFGAFVKVTESATAKTQIWRTSNTQYAPAVAFSPDGTKLAGAVTQGQPSSPDGTKLSVLIWAVPK